MRPLERFLKKVRKDPRTGCWHWIGARHRSGRPIFFYRGNKSIDARLWAYFRFRVGVAEPNCPGYAINTCRTRYCVNPEHIKLAPDQLRARGNNHPRRKISYATACEIRRRAVEEKLSTRQLAKIYSLGQSTICKILANKLWRVRS